MSHRHLFEVHVNRGVDAPPPEEIAHMRGELAKFNAERVPAGGDPMIVLRARVRPVGEAARRQAAAVLSHLRAAAVELVVLQAIDPSLSELIEEQIERRGLPTTEEYVERSAEEMVDDLAESIEHTFDAIDALDAMTAARRSS